MPYLMTFIAGWLPVHSGLALQVKETGSPAIELPYQNGRVFTCRREHSAIERDADREYASAVPGEFLQLFAGGDVPHIDVVAKIGGDEFLAIGREGQRYCLLGPFIPILLALEFAQKVSVRAVSKVDLLPGSFRENFAVGRKGKRISYVAREAAFQLGVVAFCLPYRFAGRHVDDRAIVP